MLRGIEPAGISEVFSCIFTRCQSRNCEPFMSNVKRLRLEHSRLEQRVGFVNWNCWSTLCTTV